MRKFLCAICILAILLMMSACGEKTLTVQEQVELFVTTADNVNRLEYATLNDNLQKLGLCYQNSTPVLNEAFFQEYLSKYSEEQFMRQFASITRSDCYAEYSLHAKTVMESFASVSAIQVISCHPDKLEECTGSFYSEPRNRYADPIPHNSIAYGDFYNHDGTNSHIQSRESTQEVDFYGDFALLTSRDYDYNQGAYEWRNGTFYDELPSWDLNIRRHFYYKGHHVCPMSDFTDTMYVYDYNDGRADVEFYGVVMTNVTPSGNQYYTFKTTSNPNWKTEDERESIYKQAMSALEKGEDQQAYDLLVTIASYRDSLDYLNNFGRVLVSCDARNFRGTYHWDYSYTHRADKSLETIRADLNHQAILTYHLNEAGQLTYTHVEFPNYNQSYDIQYTYDGNTIHSEADILTLDSSNQWQPVHTVIDYCIKNDHISCAQQEGYEDIEYSYTYNLEIPDEIIKVVGALSYAYTYEMVYGAETTSVHQLTCFPLIFAQ